ncbi:MAG: hypothetical protein Q9167_007611 [Letrouitia subvulpina]
MKPTKRLGHGGRREGGGSGFGGARDGGRGGRGGFGGPGDIELFNQGPGQPPGVDLNLYRNDVATDFMSTMISRNNIEVEGDGYLVTYRAENEDDPAPNAKQYRAGLMFGSKEEIIQALNIVVGHHPKAASTITTVAANRHFDRNSGPHDKMSLGAGLQAIRGFFVSVRAATARILVNVQVKNMAFYNEGPLDGIMREYTQQNGPNKLNLAKFLKKLSVDVTHIVRSNRSGRRIPRIKTIQGLATKDDGRSQAHPPIVNHFGAGTKEVQCYLDDAGEGKSLRRR